MIWPPDATMRHRHRRLNFGRATNQDKSESLTSPPAPLELVV